MLSFQSTDLKEYITINNSSVDENYETKFLLVKFHEESPKTFSFEKSWILKAFLHIQAGRYRTISKIPSHRQHAGDPKFQLRDHIRCRIR